MSVSTEVQRTLVKSPPELWSELSNPEALARHLAEIGEIRITSVEPETKVEWEAEGATGIVQLKQSGWGTKVTLSVTRTAPTAHQPPSEPVAAELEPIDPDPDPEPEDEPIAARADPEPEDEPEPIVARAEPEDEPEPVVMAPEPQLGFFARLFRKRKAKQAATAPPNPGASAATQPAAEPRTQSAAEPEPEPAIEVVALAAPEPVYPDPPAHPEASEPAEDLASELESLEAQMAAETTELLTGVLDRLGAAHHRPFSRG